MSILWIVLLGAAGVLTRYGIDSLGSRAVDASSYPLSTFLINVGGCALAGLVAGFASGQRLPEELRLGLLVGFCGGLTTFSAYALQSVQLFQRGAWSTGWVYLIASPAAGLLAVALGVTLASR